MNRLGKNQNVMARKTDKTSRVTTNGYQIHTDHRKRAKEHLLNAPFVDSNNLGSFEKHGKVHQVQFKITPFAEKVASEVASLFGMSLSQYAKAVLYRDLGLIFEPVDRRRKRRLTAPRQR